MVRNISPGTTVDTLRRLFSKYGDIKDANIPPSVNSRGQHFGFVEFSTIKEAETAFDILHNTSLDGCVMNCQFVDQRDLVQVRKKDPPPPPPTSKTVPLPAPLLAAAPINPSMEMTRYNTAAGGEFTIDSTGRLARRSHIEEEQRSGRARSPAPQNPLLIQSAIAIAANDSSNIEADKASSLMKSGVMAYVKTHPKLVINYDHI